MTAELMARAHGDGRGPARPLPGALVRRRVGWVAMGERTGLHDQGGARRRMPPVDQETPSVPIFQTSTFRFDDPRRPTPRRSRSAAPGYTYTRGYGNPTVAGVRAADGRARGHRGGVRVRIRHGGDPLGAHGARGRGRPGRDEQRAVRRHVLARHRRSCPRFGVEVDDGRPARPRCGASGAPGRGALLHRDDREPERDGRRSRGAGRALPRRGRPARGRQHVRVALPLHARARTASTSCCTRRRSTSAGTTT